MKLTKTMNLCRLKKIYTLCSKKLEKGTQNKAKVTLLCLDNLKEMKF